MITYDAHTHSAYSFDSAGGYTVEDMCRAALSKGITHLAITDHYDINSVIEGMYPSPDFERLDAEFEKAERKYRDKLILSRGIELGSAIQYPNETLAFLKERKFDTVLASLHFIRGHDDFYHWDMKSLDNAALRDMWRTYLSELEETVDFGHSDVLCHLTYPLRYVKLAGVDFDISFSDSALERILKKVINSDMLLEVNTSGFRQGIGEPLPSGHILEIYKDLGGKLISVGSDAHAANDIGASYTDTAEFLKKHGFESVHFIKNKEIYKEKI